MRLLVETALGDKERKLLDYGVHSQALSLLKERERVCPHGRESGGVRCGSWWHPKDAR